MILLDTSVLIEFLSDGGRADDVEELIVNAKATISAISAYELLAGVRSVAHIEQRNELITLIHVVPVDRAIAGRAAELYTTLRASGVTIDNEDIMIAATALHLSLPVLTTNIRHFEAIPGLSLA